MKIRKKDSTAILNSLGGGVVPSRGLQYIMVGRAEESRQILQELQSVKDGASYIKFFIGPFGAGKSFIQALIKQIAFNEKFVVASADFTPERRLYDGGNGKALAVYTELMKNAAISTMPEGNALPTILEKWINEVQMKVAEEKSYEDVSFDNPQFIQDVETAITKQVSKMDELTGGFDFARVLSLYYKGFAEDNQEMQRSALRWLRGEYSTKTEARQDLGVRTIIDDNNYYEYIKVFSQFVKQIGYAGFVVNFDEAINLYKINHPGTREKNYETILKIFNDTLQGTVEGLYITFGGTPEFLEDERKGLYSYGALKRRLLPNEFETLEQRDLSQPVVKLVPLKHEETLVLLEKITQVHAAHYEYEPTVSIDEMKRFIQKEYSMPGAHEHLTPGDIVKKYLSALNIIQQNPNFDKTTIFGAVQEEPKANSTVMGRFSSTKG